MSLHLQFIHEAGVSIIWGNQPNWSFQMKFISRNLIVSGFDKSSFGIEWMRYEKGSPIADIIKENPHIAVEVDDLDYELQSHNFIIITPPTPLGVVSRSQ